MATSSPLLLQGLTITGELNYIGGGLYMNEGPSNVDVVIRNNIIVGNLKGVESFFADPYTLTTFENNLVFGNTIDFYNAQVNPIGTKGNISVAPGFVNESVGDFHLAPNSPAIDTGTAVGAPPDDIEHKMRPIDGNGDGIAIIDMGAYEAPAPFNLCAPRRQQWQYPSDQYHDRSLSVY